MFPVFENKGARSTRPNVRWYWEQLSMLQFGILLSSLNLLSLEVFSVQRILFTTIHLLFGRSFARDICVLANSFFWFYQYLEIRDNAVQSRECAFVRRQIYSCTQHGLIHHYCEIFHSFLFDYILSFDSKHNLHTFFFVHLLSVAVFLRVTKNLENTEFWKSESSIGFEIMGHRRQTGRGTPQRMEERSIFLFQSE
jgi:hypothetical protein